MPVSDLADRYGPMIEHERERAIGELEDLTRREPGSIEAHALLARAYQRCMDFAACAETTRTLLKLKPDHFAGLHQLGLSLSMIDDDEGALAAYREAMRITRSSGAAHAVGVMLHRSGRLDEARTHLDRLFALLPPEHVDLIPTLSALIRICRDQGRVLEADRYAQALQLRSRSQPITVGSCIVDRDHSFAFPEWIRLAEKSCLAELLMKSRSIDPGGRFPESFALPQERAGLLDFAAQAPPGTFFIAKPVRGSGGQGITITDSLSAVAERKDAVVQRYIDRPYLIDGRKGHLRIYVLICGLQPLRAYMYEEGVVRFAPEAYDPRPGRLSDISMHVTNTALHKDHPGLVISQNPAEEDVGAIWSLSAVLKRLAADGHDPAAVLDEVRGLVGWFLRQVEREGLFSRQAARAPLRAFGPKLLGLDVLLDADARPWLIEMQTSPAATGAPLVNRINGELFATILSMTVGVAAQDDMPLDGLGALRDPARLVQREAEIEYANRGRFRPIWN